MNLRLKKLNTILTSMILDGSITTSVAEPIFQTIREK